MTTFNLPDLGEGLTESEIVEWKVAEGDTVELNQTLAEVETAKAVVELPSPYAGVVRRLHAAAGDTVDVGAALIEFDVEDDDEDEEPMMGAPVAAQQSAATQAPATPAPAAETAPAEKAPAAPERVAVLVGSVKVTGGERPTRRARSFAVDPFERVSRPAPRRGGGRAMPPVRALARQRGIELADIEGSGEGGLVTRADLDRAAALDQSAQSAQSATASAPSRASTRTRVTGLRKHTAAAMTASAFTAPHAAVFLQVDVTETLELVRDLKAQARGGVSPSFLALACTAIIHAAARTPDANASFHADTNEIERFGHVNLGVAVATDRGLVVASVDDADLLDATALTEQIADRAAKARAGSLTQAELTSSTITVSNVGVFGVDGGVPIINPGEAAIIALGTVRRTPWEHHGEIALRDVMMITVSFDHRIIDGKEGSAFIADIGRMLERPALALAGLPRPA